MISIKKTAGVFGSILLLSFAYLCYAGPKPAQAQTAPAANSRQVGTVKAIAGNLITLTTDSGTNLNISVADNAKLVRTAPGQKDLTGATVISLSDIQVGDRMLVKGKPSDDGKSTIASGIIVMKKTDIAEKQSREREDWQKRGVGGPVTTIDVATGDITLSSSATKSVIVHTKKNTIIRRYAADSIKFDDAKVATLDQIKVGDQLRARGARTSDGSELTADEIVAGTFRNIAATILSTNTADNSLTVTDLATKKPIIVKVTADSQMRNLPPMIAQNIAARLKGGPPQGNGQPGGAPTQVAARPAGEPHNPMMNGNGHPGGPGTGAPRGDINQMLGRLPAVTVAELKKGDAVMIVSTQGDGSSVTAITLLSGVEPILTASPRDGSMILSAWNLNSSPGGEGGEGPAQ